MWGGATGGAGVGPRSLFISRSAWLCWSCLFTMTLTLGHPLGEVCGFRAFARGRSVGYGFRDFARGRRVSLDFRAFTYY